MHERYFSNSAIINDRLSHLLQEAWPEDSRSSQEEYLTQLGSSGFPEQMVLLFITFISLYRGLLCVKCRSFVWETGKMEFLTLSRLVTEDRPLCEKQ